MKKHLMRVVNANLFSKFIKTSVTVLLITVAAGARAQVSNVAAITNDGEGTSRAVVTYVASGKESLYFDVKVDNAEGERFTVLVKEENGSTIYRGTFLDKDFKKRFVLPKTDSNKLTFLIKTENGSKSETFEINTNTRIFEEVVVKKVI